MDTSILTRRIGPLPGWAWGGLVAVGVWWFFLRSRAGATSSSGSSGAGTAPNANSVYGLGYAQGMQAAGANAPPGGTSAPSAGPNPANILKLVTQPQSPGQWPQGVPVWDAPHTGAGIAAYLPYGGSVTATGAPVNATGFTWYPVATPGGGQGWVSSNLVAGFGGGVGGAGGTARKHAVGSRAAWLHHDAHPLIGANVRYAHYVRAVGGPANHRREVHRVAHQAGVHPARIAMLNPHYTGRIRVA